MQRTLLAFLWPVALLNLAALQALRAQPGIDPVNTNTTSWPGYLAIGPPLFPREHGESTACYSNYNTLTGAACTTYDSQTLPLQLHNCVHAGSASSGTLVLHRTAVAGLQGLELLGTAIYRLRVTGPAGMWLLEPSYCRPDLALTTYSLPGPGRYSIEVLMLYSSFSFAAPNTSKAMSQPWAGYLTLSVGTAADAAEQQQQQQQHLEGQHLEQSWSSAPDESILAAPSDGVHADSSADDDSAPASSLPLCPDTGPRAGRWRFRTWPAPDDVAPLLRTCIWGDELHDCARAERRGIHTASHPGTLYWQPAGCRMRSFAGMQAAMASAAAAAAAAAEPADGAAGADRPERGAQWREQHGEELAGEGGAGDNSGEAGAEAEAAAITPAQCLPPGRRVCFLGDSHARYLHNSLVMWETGFVRAPNNSIKELLASPANTSVYFRMLWGHDWPEPEQPLAGGGSDSSASGSEGAGGDPSPLVAAGCTDVFANFGQWPASYRSGPAPFSAGQYAAQVAHVRRKLAQLRARHGVRVYWITTVVSSLKARLESAGIDWRTDPLLLLYNRIAADVMEGGAPRRSGGGSEGDGGDGGSEGGAGSRRVAHKGGPAQGQAEAGAEAEVRWQRQLQAQGQGLWLGLNYQGKEGPEEEADEGQEDAGEEAGEEEDDDEGQEQGTGAGVDHLRALLSSLRAAQASAVEEATRAGGQSGSSVGGDDVAELQPPRPRRRRRLRQQRRRAQELLLWGRAPAAAAAGGSRSSSVTSSSNSGGGRGVKGSGAGGTETALQRVLAALPLPLPSRRAAEDEEAEAAAGGESQAGRFPGQLPSRHLGADGGAADGSSTTPTSNTSAASGEEAEAAAGLHAPIPLIDTFSATRILHEATWDGIHYTNRGLGGELQLTAVLHALCATGGGTGGAAGDDE